MIETFSLLLAVAFGYYLGLQRHERDIKLIKKAAGKAQAIVTGTNPTGPRSGIIYRPSAKRINQLNHKAGESEQAMVESLDKIPELKKLKDKLAGQATGDEPV